MILFFFFFNDTATTEIYTLSLHDALPIFTLLQLQRSVEALAGRLVHKQNFRRLIEQQQLDQAAKFCLCTSRRSEEHTSELQSPCNLVCRLLLEKKKKRYMYLINLCVQIRH